MDAVRVLSGVLCLAFAGGSGVFSSGVVDYDKGDAGAIVRAAQKEVGVCEAGENTGRRVDEYNAYVGHYKVAWCASFVSWCHGQAGYKEPRTAWSPALFVAGRISQKAVRGAVLGIYYPKLGRIGHCGIVEYVKGDMVHSIEGNTNGNGGREGDGVYRRIRHKRTIAKYSNWGQR